LTSLRPIPNSGAHMKNKDIPHPPPKKKTFKGCLSLNSREGSGVDRRLDTVMV